MLSGGLLTHLAAVLCALAHVPLLAWPGVASARRSLAQGRQQPLACRRGAASRSEALAGPRMLEAEHGGVERLPVQLCQRRPGVLAQTVRLGLEAGPVELIAEKRVAAMGHVDADLVGPAGLQLAAHEAGEGSAPSRQRLLRRRSDVIAERPRSSGSAAIRSR